MRLLPCFLGSYPKLLESSDWIRILILLNTVVLWLLNTVTLPVTCYSNYKREALLTLSDFNNADDVTKVDFICSHKGRHPTETVELAMSLGGIRIWIRTKTLWIRNTDSR
jgi:hypothetical protein